MGENSEAWSKVGAFYTWGIDHMTRLHKCSGGGGELGQADFIIYGSKRFDMQLYNG